MTTSDAAGIEAAVDSLSEAFVPLAAASGVAPDTIRLHALLHVEPSLSRLSEVAAALAWPQERTADAASDLQRRGFAWIAADRVNATGDPWTLLLAALKARRQTMVRETEAALAHAEARCRAVPGQAAPADRIRDLRDMAAALLALDRRFDLARLAQQRLGGLTRRFGRWSRSGKDT